MASDETLISIGVLSKAAGIPVETLRTWERRYGHPRAQRLPSGHRRYPMAEAERLRSARDLMQRGYRPAEVLALSLTELDSVGRGLAGGLGTLDPDRIQDRLLEAVQAYDSDTLRATLLRAWDDLGALDFLEQICGPLLTRIGAAWEAGELSVAQEHHASEQLRTLLDDRWRRMQSSQCRARFLLATLPGEQHHLGLHMAAIVIALYGARVIWLGADAPLADIASAAELAQADGLVLSMSVWGDVEGRRADLAQLRALVPGERSVVVGGGGAPAVLAGVERLADFRALADHVRTIIARR